MDPQKWKSLILTYFRSKAIFENDKDSAASELQVLYLLLNEHKDVLTVSDFNQIYQYVLTLKIRLGENFHENPLLEQLESIWYKSNVDEAKVFITKLHQDVYETMSKMNMTI